MAAHDNTAANQPHALGARRSPVFYEQVWEMVRLIPAGSVMTYGQIALELGAPMQARAVGYAMANLPAENDVPWWRVINASGGISLKGRGAAADLQRTLLEREGVAFIGERTDLQRYRWWPGPVPQPGAPSAAVARRRTAES